MTTFVDVRGGSALKASCMLRGLAEEQLKKCYFKTGQALFQEWRDKTAFSKVFHLLNNHSDCLTGMNLPKENMLYVIQNFSFFFTFVWFQTFYMHKKGVSIDRTVPFNMYYVGFRAFKSPPTRNALWLRAFKSPYINACRVNSNILKKKEKSKMPQNLDDDLKDDSFTVSKDNFYNF